MYEIILYYPPVSSNMASWEISNVGPASYNLVYKHHEL